MAGVFCNSCGHRNPAGATWCSSCGAPLEPVLEVSEELTDALPAVSEESDANIVVTEEPAEAMLVVTRGATSGSRFVLSDPVTRAGRHPDSHIFLDDVTVSRRHAEISQEDGRFVVHDVGSLNGTYLNRQRVDDAVLANGDELQIGKYKLVFLAPHGPASGPGGGIR